MGKPTLVRGHLSLKSSTGNSHQAFKAVLEEVLQEEMTHHLEAGYRELTPTRRGERNGHYTRNLLTPAGRIERLEIPRDREGEFVTEVFERYKRMRQETWKRRS